MPAARLCVIEPLIPHGGRFATIEESELLAEDPHMVPVVRKQWAFRRYGTAKLTLSPDGLGSNGVHYLLVLRHQIVGRAV